MLAVSHPRPIGERILPPYIRVDLPEVFLRGGQNADINCEFVVIVSVDIVTALPTLLLHRSVLCWNLSFVHATDMFTGARHMAGALQDPTQTESLPSVSVSSRETGRVNYPWVLAHIDLLHTYPTPVGEVALLSPFYRRENGDTSASSNSSREPEPRALALPHGPGSPPCGTSILL